MKWEYAWVRQTFWPVRDERTETYDYRRRLWINLPGADKEERLDQSDDGTGTHRPTVLSVLNWMGDNGWEMVGVTVLKSFVVRPPEGIQQSSQEATVQYSFKRPKAESQLGA